MNAPPRTGPLPLPAHAAALVERHDHRDRLDRFLEARDLLLDAVFEDEQIVGVDLDRAAVGVAGDELERRRTGGGAAAK